MSRLGKWQYLGVQEALDLRPFHPQNGWGQAFQTRWKAECTWEQGLAAQDQ